MVANILAGPLLQLSDVIISYAKPSADIALSGILDSQAEKLQQHYQAYCQLEPIEVEGEWVRISGIKQ